MTTSLAVVVLGIVFLAFSISGRELHLSSQQRNGRSSRLNSSLQSTSMQDEDIKLAYMKEILSKLGMKDRPPPIPKNKRKQNIPRPVYDGGIALQDTNKAKETQIIIAAEEGNSDACDEHEACFRFKLNYDHLREHVINYAHLHIYNEADAGKTINLFRTINIKEVVNGGKISKENDDIRDEDKNQQGAAYRGSRGADKNGKEDYREERQEEQDKKGDIVGLGEDKDGETIIRDTDVIQEQVSKNVNESKRREKPGVEDILRRKTEGTVKIEDSYPSKRNCSEITGSNCHESRNDRNVSAKTEDVDKRIDKSFGDEIELLSTNILLSSKSWFKVNLKEVILKWVQEKKNDSTIHALKFICNNCQSSLKICSKPRYRPFIVIKITERIQRSERKRRSYAVNCVPGYEKCCRRRLYVNFEEIKWHDWIIEPPGFEVNYCEGRCTGTGVISAHSHAVVKQRLMGKKKHSFLSVCCVPVKFSSLTLLHYDDEGLIHKTVLENMTVEKCGCV